MRGYASANVTTFAAGILFPENHELHRRVMNCALAATGLQDDSADEQRTPIAFTPERA
jgi:hypothetical protein